MEDYSSAVQTLSYEKGVEHFDTLEAALAHARSDSMVWKISFRLKSGEKAVIVRTWCEHDSNYYRWILQPLPLPY